METPQLVLLLMNLTHFVDLNSHMLGEMRLLLGVKHQMPLA
jgi:hypothetical protein